MTSFTLAKRQTAMYSFSSAKLKTHTFRSFRSLPTSSRIGLKQCLKNTRIREFTSISIPSSMLRRATPSLAKATFITTGVFSIQFLISRATRTKDVSESSLKNIITLYSSTVTLTGHITWSATTPTLISRTMTEQRQQWFTFPAQAHREQRVSHTRQRNQTPA